jgi:hypothetical protein
LIGGIVGGVVALLLVGVLVAFLVSRRRRKDESSKGASMQSVRQSGLSPESNYGVIGSLHNYDAWSTNENNYATPSPNRSEYENGDLANVY